MGELPCWTLVDRLFNVRGLMLLADAREPAAAARRNRAAPEKAKPATNTGGGGSRTPENQKGTDAWARPIGSRGQGR